jgi:hypothetical protein
MILDEHAEKQEVLLSHTKQKQPMSRQKAISFADKVHLQSDRENLGKAPNFVTMTHLHDTRAIRVKITAGSLVHSTRDLMERLERSIGDLKRCPRLNKVVLLHALLVHRIMRVNNAPVPKTAVIMRVKNAPKVPKTAVNTVLPLSNESLECARMVSRVSVVSTKDATAISTFTKKILL